MTKARSQDERETTITYDNGERVCRIYTSRPADQARLRRAGVEPYDGNDYNGFRYKVPMTRLFWKIRPATSARTGKVPASLARWQRGKTTKVGVSGATPEQA